MKRGLQGFSIWISGITLLILTMNVPAAVRYVDLSSPNPTPPYTDWNSAATNIQDAINAAADGDQILVTNGVYNTGGQTVYGSLTNRVAVTKPLSLQSVNGPAVTILEGFPIIGENAVRCVYLTNGASLVGFTLTKGATLLDDDSGTLDEADRVLSGGGLWCESTNSSISNCVLIANTAQGLFYGGGARGGTLNNCLITSNSAGFGGGAYSNVLNYCLLTHNSASWSGGGAMSCGLEHCMISDNSARYGGGMGGGVATSCVISNNTAKSGGGASGSMLNYCMIVSNSAFISPIDNGGGGSEGGALNNCTLLGNTTDGSGGGALMGSFNNCLFIWNSAVNGGGGAYMHTADRGTMNNCTVISNSATFGGGGVNAGTMFNSIVYYNSPEDGYAYYMTNNCIVIAGAYGANTITNPPLFMDPAAGDFRLQPSSPCINAGYNPASTNSTDFAGNPRIVGGTVDIGAYEFQSPASILSYAWAQQFGLPTDGSTDYADPDSDAFNNWQEWIAGTIPTNALSVLKMVSVSTNVSGLNLCWQSVSGRTYFLERSTDLGGQPPFSTVQSNLLGQVSTTSYTDTSATNGGPYFYRVGVQ
jgi:hypothetical protein